MGKIFKNLLYDVLRVGCTIYMWLACGYTYKKAPEIKGPYLVVANHNMKSDPVMVACAFRERLAFVAGENTMRMGILSKFLSSCFDLILRRKGDRDASTVYSILRHLKNGASVCLFPEGNRSWNGKTGFIPPATAKMARRSKAALVTFRLTGSYLTSPRWSGKNRKGKVFGECVNIYTPEVLTSMTDAEIYEALVRDLHVDAFADQNEKLIAYSGKNLAANIETGYYICPECGNLGTIKSSGNDISCSCGMHAAYNKYGFFEGFKFKTTAEWDDWQREKLSEIITQKGDEPICFDDNVRLMRVNDDHEMVTETVSRLTAYSDRLEIGDYTFKYSDLRNMTMHGNANTTFATDNGYFEVTSDNVWCARKYLEIFMLCTEGKYGV